MRLIDANAYKASLKKWKENAWKHNERHDAMLIADCLCELEMMPTVDAVSRGAHDQVRWERDIAMEQLEEHGIPFGGIAPDVVKVVRCKDCKHWEQYNACDGTKPHRCMNHDAIFYKRTAPNDFCSYGERKDNEI